MIEKQFVQDSIKKVKIDEWLEDELDKANYSHIDFTKTSTSTKITIYSEKPGLVIGRGGHRIKEVTRKLKDDFGIENPQVEAQEVEEPDLDAEVVAKNIQGWLEKGGHPKRVGNTYTRRVMDAGAVGVQIEIAGKLSGSRGRSEKFTQGYVKKCGNTAEQYVDSAYRAAVTQPGALGVKVRIMKELPGYMTRQQVSQDVVEDEEPEPVVEDEGQDGEEQEAEETADEAAETEASSGSESDIDYEELVTNTIKDIKAELDDEDDVDYEALLEAEQDNKDRKTLVSWIESQME
ncbi:MAG: 30S ribosomal protein S3 [Candidatus Nanohaloarchaea archaeon]|nr:30S ribosomal protein S3 [Candidatus Nanohaloarchaea archaeon]